MHHDWFSSDRAFLILSIEALLLLQAFWIAGSRTVFSDKMLIWWMRASHSITYNLLRRPVKSRWTTLLEVSRPIVILLAALLTILGLPSTLAGNKLVEQGTTVVVLTYASLWLLVISCLWVLSAKSRVPVIALGLFALLIYNQTEFGNRYGVREIDGHSASPRGRRMGGFVLPLLSPTTEDAFRAWLSVRKDRELFKAHGVPYPVFIALAPGGGIRAAYMSAMSLASIQDACPRFKDHLFCISTVSGGSVGAVTFKAACRVKPENYQTWCEGVLGRDLLSPVVASLLGPDLLSPFVD
jgi:hypothetical protein